MEGRVRVDRRCGPEFPLEDGLPSECDGGSFFPCCSKWGYCGPGSEHCACDSCVDYRTGEQKSADWVEGRWRTDRRCGADFPLPDGSGPGQCNPSSPDEFCCSKVTCVFQPLLTLLAVGLLWGGRGALWVSRVYQLRQLGPPAPGEDDLSLHQKPLFQRKIYFHISQWFSILFLWSFRTSQSQSRSCLRSSPTIRSPSSSSSSSSCPWILIAFPFSPSCLFSSSYPSSRHGHGL